MGTPKKTKDKARQKYPLFSNGTEFSLWQGRNCERCFKAVWYNEKTDTYPKYRCAIQKRIEEAYLGDGCGNKRDYEATHQVYCPYAQRSRIPYQTKRKNTSDAQMPLFNINDYGESEDA